MKNTSKLFSNYSRYIFIKCPDQTKILRYVWLIWGNFKWDKRTNIFVPIKENTLYSIFLKGAEKSYGSVLFIICERNLDTNK